MTNLEIIKESVGVTDDLQDSLITSIVARMESIILIYINADVIPKQLNGVLIDSAIAKYNRNGDEGYASVSIAGTSYAYQSILEEYYPILDKYLDNNRKWIFI